MAERVGACHSAHTADESPGQREDLGTHHLVGQQQHRLEAELSGAEVEEVLETGPQQLHDHHIVVTLGPAPFDGRDAHCVQGKEA